MSKIDGKMPQKDKKSPTCPNCSQPAGGEDKPFCSRRCAEIDLGRWLKGGYAIAGDPVLSNDEMNDDSEEH
jgi:endogenous inhibitor of DNA gyrase (YacG/DUF329 family)